MISSAHSRGTSSPALHTNAATNLSSCSVWSLPASPGRLGHSLHESSKNLISSHRNSTRRVSVKDSSGLFNSVHYSSHKSLRLSGSPQNGVPSPLYHHQNRIIELKSFRMIVQNGEVRFGRHPNLGDADSEDDIGNTATTTSDVQLAAATQTRRDILIRSSTAVVLAAANFGGLGGKEAAEASVSRQVRLKDVDNQLLQDALRAAVTGDLENAETLFTELIKEEPSSASGWSNRGSVRISLGKYDLATNDFTKAIELAPQAPVPYLNRAISYEAQGRYGEAIADCKTAIENDPEEPAAWFNLGNVEARVKDYDTSLLAYQKASLLAPGIAGYRLRQALVLFQVGRREESKKLLQGLVRKYPNYTEAHAALAALLWSEGQRSNAEEQFSEATNREPLYSKISWVETELQWPPGVLQAFAKFLSIDYPKS